MLLVFFRQKRLFSYKKGIALFSTLFYNCTVEIYIEKVIIENYLYTYLIIALSCLILKYKVSFLRKCLGAVVATILAIVSAYMVLNPIGNILYKLLTAYFICYVTLPCKSFKYQIINFLIFMLLSFMYRGILLILYFSLESVGLVFDTMPIYIVMLSILIISKI